MRIVFRADGNSSTGVGHIFRLIALAAILKEEFECVFATSNTDTFVLNQIKGVCNEVIILPEKYNVIVPDQQEIAETDYDLDGLVSGIETVVLDGYWFGINYQRRLKEAGCKVVAIDDLMSTIFLADGVINHAPNIDGSLYRTANYTKLFLGLDYAILRPPFFEPFGNKENKKDSIYISLGGADYYGMSAQIAEKFIERQLFDKVHVLVSDAFPTLVLSKLAEMADNFSSLQIHRNKNAVEIRELLDMSTHAFVSASTVLLECYSRGLICTTGYNIINQKMIYDGFVEAKFAIGVGNLHEIPVETIVESVQSANVADIAVLKEPLKSDKHLLNIFKEL